VRVLQVVVATRDEAGQVREKLRRDPASFAEVARRSSIAPEGKAGGDLGWIGRGAGFPEVFDACFAMPLNVVSEVTPSPYGFHLFKVVDRKAASRRTLDQARAEIAERLRRDKRARAQEEYLATLRARASIQLDQAALAAVTP
jgi:peptidyl-prolyl cis-trans isomerase C